LPFQILSAGRISLNTLVVAALALLWTAQTAQAQRDGPPPGVIVQRAESDQFVDRVEALGTLRAYDSVEVTAKVTETITKIHFQDSQRVETGDLLAEMSSENERAELAEAEATLREAKAQLDRAKPLAQRGVSSEATLAERQRNFETARARVAAVKSRLSDRQITAPFGGLTGLRRISVGALVTPGTVITTIQDDRVMKLDFTVPSAFLATIRPGLEIEAKAAAYDSKAFKGTISAVDNAIDQDTRSITVRAELPNPDGELKAGMLMTVELLKNPRRAVVVPEQAILMRGNQSFVYVVDPDAEQPVVDQREVVIGARRPGRVEIASGLSAGEAVITHGIVKVRPGQQVRIRAVAKGGEPLTELLGVDDGRPKS
jgi:membrane fusion protein (multidrug efflux system)